MFKITSSIFINNLGQITNPHGFQLITLPKEEEYLFSDLGRAKMELVERMLNLKNGTILYEAKKSMYWRLT